MYNQKACQTIHQVDINYPIVGQSEIYFVQAENTDLLP